MSMSKGLEEDYKKRIVDVAKVYNDKFNNIRITYTYRDKTNCRKIITLLAKDSNFMHLCGIESYCNEDCNRSKNAGKFFRDCLDDCLRVENIWYSSLNKVDMKLRILGKLEKLLEKGVCICGYGKFEQLSFENAVRTNESILALTIMDNGKPNSIIDLRTNKANTDSLKNSCRVTEIKRHDIKRDIALPDIKFEFDKKKKSKRKKKDRKIQSK